MAHDTTAKRSGGGVSYSLEMKRVHVTFRERDTTISMDMTLYECLRDQLVVDGLTVRRWAQDYIDRLLKQHPRAHLNRRATSISRRVQAEAIRLLIRRLSQMEERLMHAHTAGLDASDESSDASAEPTSQPSTPPADESVSLERMRDLLSRRAGMAPED